MDKEKLKSTGFSDSCRAIDGWLSSIRAFLRVGGLKWIT
jgi:hypothetical protein